VTAALVVLGAMIGARYASDRPCRAIPPRQRLPWGSLSVNLVGCLWRPATSMISPNPGFIEEFEALYRLTCYKKLREATR
jgi:fluoride ion exporter CrcB/FEX